MCTLFANLCVINVVSPNGLPWGPHVYFLFNMIRCGWLGCLLLSLSLALPTYFNNNNICTLLMKCNIIYTYLYFDHINFVYFIGTLTPVKPVTTKPAALAQTLAALNCS